MMGKTVALLPERVSGTHNHPALHRMGLLSLSFAVCCTNDSAEHSPFPGYLRCEKKPTQTAVFENEDMPH